MEQKPVFAEILKRNRERESALLRDAACKSDDAVRRDPFREKVPDWENIRSPFFHDTDKILHSMAFTRYIDKTQVFYLFENDLVTHRVLHVQFVSKIARTICRSLRLNEDLAEAISLGHDIGHVPFGHDGEKFLNELCQKNGIGAFSHNAQSVRWMMELENKGAGLNLCLQTIDGMLSHNGEKWLRRLTPSPEKSWDDVMGEYRACMRDSEAGKDLTPMTLEGCVTRFTDVIAYVGRDIEDAIKLNVIRREDLPREAVEVLGDNNSSIINTLVLDLIESSAERDYIEYSEPVHEALVKLLDFNYHKIYLNPLVREKEGKLRRLFQVVYEDCLRELTEGHKDSTVHAFYRYRAEADHIQNTPPARIVIDFISGMTDEYFLSQARQNLIPRRFGQRAAPQSR